jgi:hypothetical protein
MTEPTHEHASERRPDPLSAFRAAGGGGLAGIRWRNLSIDLYIAGHELEHELARAMADAMLCDRLGAAVGDARVAPRVASAIRRIVALSGGAS